jgi:caa(3)-type oxidase subunit IV
MAEGRVHPNYVAVWVWLVGLLLVSVVAVYLPVPKTATIFLIFALAVVKALLVALNYMHLKSEQLLIVAMAIVPLAIAFVLWAVLYPDIALH